MPTPKKILAISGSTRKSSTNLNLINAIIALSPAGLEYNIYNGLADLPNFNPDLDTDNPPLKVIEFRQLLLAADGILICTPEYAMGVPGALKNALDWVVSSCGFSKKQVAVITASLMGATAHESLLGTLKIMEANIDESCQLLISNAKTKINSNHKIVQEETLLAIKKLIASFSYILQND
ncbi:MAG: NADPH-dependent FMN reductase [Bacteroidia bacterium]